MPGAALRGYGRAYLKNGGAAWTQKEGWEVARAKGMAKGMGARLEFRKGGDTHVTKEGKTARKGLWYNIAQKKKRGEKMRAKGAKGAPTAKALKDSQT